MHKLLGALLALGFSFLLAGTALGAGDRMVGHFSLFYFTEGETTTDSNGDKTTDEDLYQFMDLNVCYVMSDFCIGGTYFQGDITNKVTYSASPLLSAEAVLKYTGFGLTLGYSGTNGIIHATYFLSSDMELTAGTATRVYNVTSAYKIDLGYGFKVGKSRIGPKLYIVSYSFDKYTDPGGSEVEEDRVDTRTIPAFAFWFDF